MTPYKIKGLGDALTAAKWAAKFKVPFVLVREEKMEGRQVTIGKTTAAKKKIQEWMQYTWREQVNKPGTVISFHPLKSNPRATNPCTTEKNPSRGRLPKAARELAIQHKIQLGRAELIESWPRANRDWYSYIVKSACVSELTRTRRPTAANA